jgi:hypothetical protein
MSDEQDLNYDFFIGACSTSRREEKCIQIFNENVRGGYHLEVLKVDGITLSYYK